METRRRASPNASLDIAKSQIELMHPGNTVILRNAKIDMFKGSMRLAVDQWGLVGVTEPAKFVVKEDNNLSLVEYELVKCRRRIWKVTQA